MVTEIIKRNQKWGYEDGALIYKIPVDEEFTPVAEEVVVEEGEEEEASPSFGGLFGK